MIHIVQFSGGKASAVVLKIVCDQFGTSNVKAIFHDTKVEHPSNLKFKQDVCNYIGVDYIDISDGRDLWQLIVDQHTLPSCFIPFCTRILKQKQGLNFLKTLKDKFIVYNGFGTHEGHRSSGSIKACDKYGITVKSPLQELNITDEEVHRIITQDWKLDIPETYSQGFMHSNCLPCYKSGMKDFRLVWQYYPESFEKAIWAEKKVSQINQKTHTTFKRIRKNKVTGKKEPILVSLEDLVREWTDQPPIKPQTEKVYIPDDWRPRITHYKQGDLFECI